MTNATGQDLIRRDSICRDMTGPNATRPTWRDRTSLDLTRRDRASRDATRQDQRDTTWQDWMRQGVTRHGETNATRCGTTRRG